jgi:hypothetical protein
LGTFARGQRIAVDRTIELHHGVPQQRRRRNAAFFVVKHLTVAVDLKGELHPLAIGQELHILHPADRNARLTDGRADAHSRRIGKIDVQVIA